MSISLMGSGPHPSIIKSVQMLYPAPPNGQTTVTFAIAPVNVSKSVVIVNGEGSFNSPPHAVAISAFSSTSITLICPGFFASSDKLSVQVIEYA